MQNTINGSLNKKYDLFHIFKIITVGTSLFHLYLAGFGSLSAMNQRAIHWLLLSMLAFMYFPFSKKKQKISFIDFIFVILSLASGLYILLNWQEIIITRSGAANSIDIIFGIIAIIVALEAARRTIGLALPVTALVFISYIYLGPYLPMAYGHRGYSLNRLIAILYTSTEGIYGVPIGVSSSFIIMFVLFGSILNTLGGGQFFIDFAYAFAGRMRGGPAKTAIFSSALMGSISGSPIANVVTTGSFTIPLMKKTGYKPHVAGAIEAVSSTGGQIMPPIMGAAAFIMTEFTRIPYFKIAWSALIPALLYYLAVYLMVDLETIKSGIKGLKADMLPSIKKTVINGWYFLFPIIVLIYLLMSGYSPTKSAFYSIIILLVVSVISIKKPAITVLKLILQSFEEGIKSAIPVAAACASAGVIVGVISLTGLGLRFMSLVERLSGGSLIIALILTMFAALIMGMGMPTTVLYIVLATLAAPALVRLGVPILAAHLFVFYFGCISTITPPVALTSYAAAGIANADASKIGWKAFQYGIVAYIVPYMIVFGPALILLDTPIKIFIATCSAILGVIAISMSMQGILLSLSSEVAKISLISRILLFISALLLINTKGYTDIYGLIIFTVIIIYELLNKKQKSRNK